MSVIKLQKAKPKKLKRPFWVFLYYEHSKLSFPGLKINKSVLILIKAKVMSSYIINPLLLTRLVQLRWLDINLVIFSIFVDLEVCLGQ